MGFAHELAKRVVNLRYDQLPPEAVYGSRIAVLDTIGCMLAGANDEAAKIIRSVVPVADGPCVIAGTGCLASPLDAAPNT